MSSYKKDDLHEAAMTSVVVPVRKGGFFQHSRSYMLAAIGFMGIFLFGYDSGLGGGVLSVRAFQEQFGLVVDGKPVPNISQLQGNIVSILHGGAFFGALFGAPMESRQGRKQALGIGCVIFLVAAVIQTACFGSLSQFYFGRFMAGFGVGVMSMVCPTYASEIAPKEIRGRITGMFQVVVVIGVAVAFWISYGVSFMHPGAPQWRIPIGFQCVPVGLMMILLPILKESPRWLATKHRDDEALENLAWIRKASIDDEDVRLEFAEITAAIREEEENTKGSSWREILAKGNPVRFIMAFVMFTLQQWSGQNSISYYSPIIFGAIGFKGTHTTLLASGIYGLVKIVATSVFIMFGVERFGRKKPLLVGVFLMSLFLWIIGAIFYTHNPQVFDAAKNKWVTPATAETSSASIAMAVMIYLYVIPYCFSVGPIPWVICSEIFNNRTRHYGLMTAAASQWVWNFGVSKSTPLLVDAMPRGGLFFFFGAINIISLVLTYFFVPETQGVSLEAMDILFGSITAEEREADVQRRAKDLHVEETEKDIADISHNEKRRSADRMA